MAAIADAVATHADSIAHGLATRGFADVDAFLSSEAVLAMRAEADRMRAAGYMRTSESTRWDAQLERAVAYEKHNVLFSPIQGGEMYEVTPRLTEFCVALVGALPDALNARVDGLQLSNKVHTNKLAVCLGDGSRYDKHIDNMGGDDVRKVTAIVYLQDGWEPAHGGLFRAHLTEGDVDLEPRGGRLLVFYADSLVHSVLPAHAPRGEADARWALTCWLHAASVEQIRFDEAAERQHFGEVSG
jgi:SM-20-related protein